MNDPYLEDLDNAPRPTMLFSYLTLSLCAGIAIWGAIFSVPFIDPGIEGRVDDPMIVARQSDLFLIEPAAGPANGCK